MAVLLVCSAAMAAASSKPNILHIVADDLGYDDLGHDSVMGNSGKSISPHINQLMDDGIILTDYYTFKVCSPTRASLLTGRYPWGAGFYDMSDDNNHCTSEFKLIPALLKEQGYSTHALGKWDIGYINKECTPTYSGFDSFLGYYEACLSDYWYHWSPSQCNDKGPYVDLSNSSINPSPLPRPASRSLNGTYNAHIFTNEAIRIITTTPALVPLYIYLAYQNVHLACGSEPKHVTVESGKAHGLQAPCGTVDMYGTTKLDIAKVQGAMVTELDFGVGNVSQALRATGRWENTVVVLVADNGAQLDHGYNAPLRGGKHTFWEGGVRVVGWVSSPLLPKRVQGTRWSGLAHSSDWYVTFVEGLAGGTASSSGPRPSDGHNLWPALISGGASPRTEVIHQVSNAHYDATTGQSYINGTVVSTGNGDGSLGMAIRMGDFKLIIGDPGDSDFLKWPEVGTMPTAFGLSGGIHEDGTDHCRTKSGSTHSGPGAGVYLFDLANDLTESHNLANQPTYQDKVDTLRARLMAAGAGGPPAAYVYPVKVDMSAAKGRVCDYMQTKGFLEPSDMNGPAPPPMPVPPGPGPAPPVPPGPPPSGNATAECKAAGGIIAAEAMDHGTPGIACCASGCGVCGGKACGAHPGGNADCCKGEIQSVGKNCASSKAPCFIPQNK